MKVSDLTEIEKAIKDLEKSVKEFPIYNPANYRQQKFGQYLTSIKLNQDEILTKCQTLREKVAVILEELED